MSELEFDYNELKGDAWISPSFAQILKQRINAEHGVKAAETAANFEQKIENLINKGYNTGYLFRQIKAIANRTPRYAFIKNLTYENRKIEVMIDLLERDFAVFEV